ncbi:MAG: PH domain-containing protein [Bryobacterales bacterium]|jgi:hypothetical protein|nr:PH domain-containing protein [Bryobacterales bacterium]
MMGTHPPRDALAQRETLRFATRIDRWLGAVGVLYVLVALGIPVWHLGEVLGGGSAFQPAVGVLPLLILGLLWTVAVPCSYELRDVALVARSGLITVAIPLLAITRVRRIFSAESAPAWSLHRLEVSYGKTRKLLISPEREAEFLRELKSRAPQLLWVGDELAAFDE